MTESEFSRRVRAMTDRLWRISWSILRSGADADDALQESLMRAWKATRRLRDESLFETWLTRILVNECKRILAKRGRFLPIPDTYEVPEVDNKPLYDAIGTLKPEMRLPLILHYMEGYPIEEVAKVLRLTESAVKVRLHRARKLLKKELNEEAAEDERV